MTVATKPKSVPLGDAVKFASGKAIKPGGVGKYRVYGSNGIIGGTDEPLHENAIILGRVGAYCGSVAYCRNPFWASDNTIVVQPLTPDYDIKFLYYALLDAGLNSYAGGAAQPLLTQSVIKNVHIAIPPIAEQVRIATILSAYDDFVENNLRRIEVLEHISRALYREWFVEFRFPGCDGIRKVHSTKGRIPEGWKVKTLAEVADINQSQISLRKPPHELHYIDIASVGPGRVESLTTYAFADAPGRARRIVRDQDILWSCVRPNRRSHVMVLDPVPNTIASTGFAVLTAKAIPASFLYEAVTTDEFVAYLTNHATGAAYPAVTASTFENAAVLAPPPDLVRRFDEIAQPIRRMIWKLTHQNRVLRASRSLLLPRLLSGELSVDVIGTTA